MYDKEKKITATLFIVAVLILAWTFNIIPHNLPLDSVITWGGIALLAVILYILSS